MLGWFFAATDGRGTLASSGRTDGDASDDLRAICRTGRAQDGLWIYVQRPNVGGSPSARRGGMQQQPRVPDGGSGYVPLPRESGPTASSAMRNGGVQHATLQGVFGYRQNELECDRRGGDVRCIPVPWPRVRQPAVCVCVG